MYDITLSFHASNIIFWFFWNDERILHIAIDSDKYIKFELHILTKFEFFDVKTLTAGYNDEEAGPKYSPRNIKKPFDVDDDVEDDVDNSEGQYNALFLYFDFVHVFPDVSIVLIIGIRWNNEISKLLPVTYNNKQTNKQNKICTHTQILFNLFM